MWTRPTPRCPRDYLRAHHGSGSGSGSASGEIVGLFAERAADYRAVVERVPEPELPAAIARALSARAEVAPAPFVIPAGLPPGWLTGLPAAIELAADEPPLSAARLDQLAGVVTGCAVAIAETGTIILDHGPGQGRRLLTLVPDFHLGWSGLARSPPTWPTRSRGWIQPVRTRSSRVPRPPATSS